MKKITGLLLGVVVLGLGANVAMAQMPAVEPPFKDVDGENFAYVEISWLKQNGVVQGYEDGTFRPDQKINRAEFLKMVYEADPAYVTGSMAINGDPKGFSDVKEDSEDWFVDYVLLAQEQGVINGYEDGSFKPNNNINYAEALKIVINQYLPEEEPDGELCEDGDFNDDRDDDDEHLDEDAWYYNYVKIADTTCISDFGSSAFGAWGYFNVGVEITRADMAKILYRALARSEGQYDEDEPSVFLRPKTLAYCRGEGEALDNGRVEFPSAGEYDDLPFLGQLFTAIDYCGYQSAERLEGVEEGDAAYSLDYELGSRLTVDSEGASDELEAVLKEIGFVCKDNTVPCEEYELEDTVDIAKLFLLAEFVEEIEDDDCVNCG